MSALSFGCFARLGLAQVPAPNVREVQVAFSPRGDALSLILRELRQARKSVDVGMFYLSHSNLIDALCFLAGRQRIPVRVFVDSSAAEPADRHVLDKLTRYGVRVYVVHVPAGKMHLKCAIVDRQTVITGAANWTPQAFDLNIEDTLILRSPDLARQYLARLDQLIAQSEPYYEEASGRVRLSPMSFPNPSRSLAGGGDRWAAPRSVRVRPGRDAEVFFSPTNPGVQILAEQIRTATSSVLVAMYQLSETALRQSLAEKAQTGTAPVRLLVSAEMLSSVSRPVLQDLAKAGVEIAWWNQDRSSMHLKAAVIDGRFVWTGSANWTNGGLQVNVEDLLFLESPALAAVYENYLRDLFSRSQVFQPAGRESEELVSEELRSPGGFLMGLPPTGPRTNWRERLRDEPFPAFDVTASIQYLSDEQYFPVLLELVKTARQSILVSMYVFPDPKPNEPCREQLVGALTEAAKRGVYVYLMLNMPGSEGKPISQAHEDWAESLRARSLDVRLHVPATAVHDKLVVVDLAKVLIGSHNWTEGALSGRKVYESSLLLVLPQPDIRFADYVFSREVVRDMRSRDHWAEELRCLRHLMGLSSRERESLAQELEAPP